MRHHVLIAGALLTASTAAAQKRAITFDDFAAVRAVSDPQPSPDGKVILYAIRIADVPANRRTAQTFVIPSAGGAPRAFPRRPFRRPKLAGRQTDPTLPTSLQTNSGLPTRTARTPSNSRI
jgi:hypothetical protein